MFKKYALRACTKSWSTNYESLLVSCNMADHRNVSRLYIYMSTLFKIISGMCSLNLHHSSKYIYHQYPHRYPNTQQSSIQFAKTHQFQSSFFLGTTMHSRPRITWILMWMRFCYKFLNYLSGVLFRVLTILFSVCVL